MNDQDQIRFSYYDEQSEESELLNAIPLGNNQFKINAIPMRAKEVSMGDIIEALEIDPNEPPEYIKTDKKSENTTLSLSLQENEWSIEQIIIPELCSSLEMLGCEIRHSKTHIGVHIPKHVDLELIVGQLEEREIAFRYLNPDPFKDSIFLPF